MKLDLASVLDNATWPALLVDPSGVIREANPVAASLFGAAMQGQPVLGASIWSTENLQTATEFLKRLDRSSVSTAELKFKVKGGGTGMFQVYVCPLVRDNQKFYLFQLMREGSAANRSAGFENGAQTAGAAPANGSVPSMGGGDTTLFRSGAFSSELTAAQRQKLDCALQLTRTVALDFNNALTGILGHSSLILSKVDPTHAWRTSLIEIEKFAQRAAEIAQDLAAFSRQDKDVRAQVANNLNLVVRRAVELFQRPGSKPVLWALQLEKRLYTANFDEAKIQQAILKVLENAVEAVGTDGRITVRTVNQTLLEPMLSPALQLGAGHYVCVEISDNGSGILPEVLPRVFEPFFTTKGGAQHRGLGLAWVYGIVTNHGGSVAVTSPPNRGTTVRIFLPAVEKIVKEHGTKVDTLRGGETVLIVDDEEMLLTLGQTILSNFGYTVLTANSGPRAIEVFEQAPSRVDLVITDMVMPGMSGREFIDNLRRFSPVVPIICTSGYVQGSGVDDQDPAYLRKPYTSQELLRKVKQVLHPAIDG